MRSEETINIEQRGNAVSESTTLQNEPITQAPTQTRVLEAYHARVQVKCARARFTVPYSST